MNGSQKIASKSEIEQSAGESVNPFTQNVDKSTTDEESLTADQIGQKLGLGSNFAKWLNEQPFDKDDPLLAISFHSAFYTVMNTYQQNEQLQADIRQALMNNGANKQVPANNGIVFRFATHDAMYAAKRNMKVTHPRAFYSLSPLAYWGNGNWIEHSRVPTISTHVITTYSDEPRYQETRFQQQSYQFFEL